MRGLLTQHRKNIFFTTQPSLGKSTFHIFPLKTKQTKRELKVIEWVVTGYSHDTRIAFIIPQYIFLK